MVDIHWINERGSDSAGHQQITTPDRNILDFKKQVTRKKVSLKSKRFFKLNLIENPWFLSTGSLKTAIFFQLLEKILLLSIIPVFHEVWVQLDIVTRLPKHSRRCGFSISMSFERNIQVLKSALTTSIYTFFFLLLLFSSDFVSNWVRVMAKEGRKILSLASHKASSAMPLSISEKNAFQFK